MSIVNLPPDSSDDPKQRVIDGLLRETQRHKPGHDLSFIHTVLQEIHTPKKPLSVASIFYAAAACIILSLIFLASKHEPETKKAVAFITVESLSGKVFLRQNGKTIEATSSLTVTLPSRIICDQGAHATVRFEDGTKVELFDGESNLQITNNIQKSVHIFSGRALCSVKPQPKSAPLLFETPHGTGEVLGTIFQLSVSNANTRLQTIKGKVRARKTEHSSPWTPVDAGHFMLIDQRDSLVAESMDIDDLQAGDVIWTQEFGNEYGHEADIEGSRIEIVENNRHFWAMKSRHTTNTPGAKWKPDQWLGLELESREALFPALADMEILVRIRAEKAGHFYLALIPKDKIIRKEHVISEKASSPVKWTEIVFNGSDLKPWRTSRALDDGMHITALTLWGFNSGSIYLDRVIVRKTSDGK